MEQGKDAGTPGTGFMEHPEAGGTRNILEQEGVSSGARCGACRFLRRKCKSECVFAPHFSRGVEGAKKFETLHRIFGAANVSKLLSIIPQENRQEAMDTLWFEAQARILDPTHGCILQVAAMERQLQLEANRLREKAQRVREFLNSRGRYPQQQQQQQFSHHAGGSSNNNNWLNKASNSFGHAAGVTNEMSFHSPPGMINEGFVGGSFNNSNLLNNLASFGHAGVVKNDWLNNTKNSFCHAGGVTNEMSFQSPAGVRNEGFVGCSSNNNNLLNNVASFGHAGVVNNNLWNNAKNSFGDAGVVNNNLLNNANNLFGDRGGDK